MRRNRDELSLAGGLGCDWHLGLPSRPVTIPAAARIGQLRLSPERYSDDSELDEIGRRVEISEVARWRIYYWSDAADRHVKVLKLKLADR